MVRTQLSAILAAGIFILFKNFSSKKKIIWFGLGGLVLVCKGFSKAARLAYSAEMVFENKNSLFT
jgi:hypothetical protein